MKIKYIGPTVAFLLVSGLGCLTTGIILGNVPLFTVGAVLFCLIGIID